MKNCILVLAMMLTTLVAMATDRFYIEDFSINAGETKQVAMILKNDVAYTALQADIYMPEGLTIEQEDGEFIFDLTDRKTRQHTVSSLEHKDEGFIRILVATPAVKNFAGNDGPLVTFNVTAADNFTGTKTIFLKNIVTSDDKANPYYLADETCIVTGPQPTGVEGVRATQERTVKAVYNLQGQRVARMDKGAAYVVTYTDGTVEKVLK